MGQDTRSPRPSPSGIRNALWLPIPGSTILSGVDFGHRPRASLLCPTTSIRTRIHRLHSNTRSVQRQRSSTASRWPPCSGLDLTFTHNPSPSRLSVPVLAAFQARPYLTFYMPTRPPTPAHTAAKRSSSAHLQKFVLFSRLLLMLRVKTIANRPSGLHTRLLQVSSSIYDASYLQTSNLTRNLPIWVLGRSLATGSAGCAVDLWYLGSLQTQPRTPRLDEIS